MWSPKVALPDDDVAAQPRRALTLRISRKSPTVQHTRTRTHPGSSSSFFSSKPQTIKIVIRKFACAPSTERRFPFQLDFPVEPEVYVTDAAAGLLGCFFSALLLTFLQNLVVEVQEEELDILASFGELGEVEMFNKLLVNFSIHMRYI